MTLRWRLAYQVGFTPWERAGEGGTKELEEVVAQAAPADGVRRRALDIGCGSGSHTLTLARLGWDVTGIDVVPRAIKRAKARAAAAHVDATFVVADVSGLEAAVEPGFQLVLDIGCFHVLGDATRDAYARNVQAVADSGAVLVMLAFQPGRALRPGPRGAATEDVVRRFRGWMVHSEEPVRTALPPLLRRLGPRLLTLRRVDQPPASVS